MVSPTDQCGTVWSQSKPSQHGHLYRLSLFCQGIVQSNPTHSAPSPRNAPGCKRNHICLERTTLYPGPLF